MIVTITHRWTHSNHTYSHSVALPEAIQRAHTFRTLAACKNVSSLAHLAINGHDVLGNSELLETLADTLEQGYNLQQVAGF